MSRRIKRYAASFELIIEMMREGWRPGGIAKCITGVPPDAVFVGATTSNSSIVYFHFTHDSFDEVKPGDLPPEGVIRHSIEYLP